MRFKAARRPAGMQLHIVLPSAVTTADLMKTQVIANVYAGDARTKVTMQVGTNGKPIELVQFRGTDPNFVAAYGRESDNALPDGRPLPDPVQTNHIWTASLPTDLKPGAHVITVKVTDRYGQEDQASRVLRVVE